MSTGKDDATDLELLYEERKYIVKCIADVP